MLVFDKSSSLYQQSAGRTSWVIQRWKNLASGLVLHKISRYSPGSSTAFMTTLRAGFCGRVIFSNLTVSPSMPFYSAAHLGQSQSEADISWNKSGFTLVLQRAERFATGACNGTRMRPTCFYVEGVCPTVPD